MNRRLVLPLLAVLGAPLPAQLELAPVFGPHMVLQRETEVAVWGRAAPHADVELRATWPGHEPVRGRADAEGRFRLGLRTPAAGGPYALLCASGNVVQRLDDVLVGEVWICSGQSNMEWPVRAAAEPEREIASANLPRIRLLTVPNVAAAAPQTDFDAAWQVCSPAKVEAFSAVGFSFGRALLRVLDVPVGLIAADWGGTPAEAWTSAAGIREVGDFDAALAGIERLTTERERLEAEHRAAVRAHEAAVEACDPGLPAPGRPVGFAVPGLDDADWDQLPGPGTWSGTPLADFDGLVWYRIGLTIPDDWAGRELVLELGPIDDDDETWFAGRKVGATQGWTAERRYTVPARLVQPGRTVVAVRVHDTAGEGGFRAEGDAPRIYPAGAPEAAIALAGPVRYRRGPAESELPRPPRRPGVGAHTPTALFNGMIAPLVPFAMRGVIWYEGESNVARAAQYERLFPALIRSWRAAFGIGDFPFLYVQIAPFAYADRGPDEPGELRDAQRRTLALVEKVGMAVTMDVGDPRDIHPRDKVTVGERLARQALSLAYGRDIVPSGPLFRSVTAEAGALRVAFDHAGGLATRDGAAPSHFELAGADGVFRPAVARIDGETILVRADGLAEPTAVRYAFGAADQPNLVNGAGLPASSFRAALAAPAAGAGGGQKS
jgi:sialate O-acetylesterase